nr:MAG TPA: hypothetical protein [Caudoviricetes sp.]
MLLQILPIVYNHLIIHLLLSKYYQVFLLL